ncbi:hypothetical protein LY76DRAFT_595284 [Colletotrichum caudatum]|nr:hypothetical protein LY76DRAFT_595284 [Colletotrichum caudatum]
MFSSRRVHAFSLPVHVLAPRRCIWYLSALLPLFISPSLTLSFPTSFNSHLTSRGFRSAA